MRGISFGIAALALGMALVGCEPAPVSVEQPASTVVTETAPAAVADPQQAKAITVNASSEVKVVPDKASFSAEVYVQGNSPEEVQAASEAPVSAVIDALTGAGVEEKSIQTSYANLSPVYDWSNETQQLVGYEMRTGIQVSDVAVDEVAALMEACTAAGATGINGPSYYASNYDEAYAQALAEAVSASKGKAEAVAQAAGVSLGGVVSVTEGYQNTTYRYTEEASMAMAADGAVSNKIAPGEVSIEAQVTVTYAIS